MKIGKATDLFRLIRETEKKSPTSVWRLLGFIKRLKQLRLYGCRRNGEAPETKQSDLQKSTLEKRWHQIPVVRKT
jgi:hypothetical protein